MSAIPDSTFADPQQVIAELQSRLTEVISERDEALQRETATGEVLQVINSSPGSLAPVFDAILEKAHRLCGVEYGALQLYDGEKFATYATRGYPDRVLEALRQPYALEPNNPLRALLDGAPLVEFPDIVEHTKRSPNPRAAAVIDIGIRSMLFLPLRKDNRLVGLITAARKDTTRFRAKHIALLQNFAAQAVIAMENARLITETREALEQQTATAEVLQVINSSPGDLAPVFDTMLLKALNLCGADLGGLYRFDGKVIHPVSVHGGPKAPAELLQQSFIIEPGSSVERLVRGDVEFDQVPDIVDTEAYRSGAAYRVKFIELTGARTALWVALRKDEALVGVFVIYRQEVRPFTDKQIALLQNFAAQAVIAMENARLLGELRERTRDLEESLEYQTATSDVLQVISRSTFDLQPVLDTLLQTAAGLCSADMGHIATRDGDVYRVASSLAFSPEWDAAVRKIAFTPGRGTIVGRTLLSRQAVQIADLPADPEYALSEVITIGKMRTGLGVPLLREGEPIGVIYLARQRVEPFTERQIELVRTFSDQAVIAIENARLINETREALEQQTATAEVLQVINSSPGDLAPVFDAMLEKALRLCNASLGHVWGYDGEGLTPLAIRGGPEVGEWFSQVGRLIPSPETPVGRVVQGEDLVHIGDVTKEPAYASMPLYRRYVDAGDIRTSLAVPLRQGGILFGIFAVYRQEVQPFSDKEIALLQNFAAQAVIAMDNARLIAETHEALEQQTATAEVLQVINASPGDLAPVFEAMLGKALRLCAADLGSFWTHDGQTFEVVAMHGAPPEQAAFLTGRRHKPGAGTILDLLLRGEEIVHIPDLADTDAYRAGDPMRRQSVDVAGARTTIAVPLRKAGRLLGLINIYRREMRPFTEKQIALLQNFAAQAVIAMENARLITETREALDQQTATAEVLGVINSSPGDLAPVFDVMLEKARRLCEATYGHLATYDGDRFYTAAIHGVPAPFAEFRKQNPQIYGPATPVGRLLEGEPIVQVIDCADTEGYRHGDPNLRAAVDLGGARTMLCVPLLKDDAVQGFITVYRQEVRPFTDKQIALLQNFAAQAVIAIENARLLDEVQQRQSELRVTFDNMADGVAMFDQTLHLAAWNRNFQELLQLPDALLAERPGFDAYIRYLTERGEFGDSAPDTEIARLRGRLGEHYYFERTRPDGTVIEVRHNPMPDGGVVLIFSDITERKRSEAEIRAARDAAEATLRDLRAAQSSLVQAQKMAALGQLTAGIAHEIKNPLNFVNNFAGLSVELLDELKETAGPVHAQADAATRAEIDETIKLLTGNLDKIAEHGRRADNIVKSMLQHSRGVTSERREVDLNNLVEEALNLAYHGARAQDQNFNITLERNFHPGLAPIVVAPQEVTRVLLNLFSNGFYAATRRARDSGNGLFSPTLAVATREAGEVVEITVRDNGTGISPEVRDKLFQPFFTTKPTGEGTGLGLSISYDIISQQHGGAITVESEPGEFTEFTIRLPRRAAAGAAA